MRKFWKSMALVCFLCWMSGMAVFASQGKIDKVQEDIEGLEKQKEKAREEAASLSDKANNLEGNLKEFNNSLAAVVEELNKTEEQLSSTRDSLEVTRKDLEAAKEKEKEQYDSMKKRIQFMYEMDTEGMLEVLLSAENFADFLSKGEYIVNIHNYDRKMLDEYRETKDGIASKEQKLKEDEKLLAELQEQQEEKKEELAVLVDSTSEKLGAAKQQLASAQADVKAYEAEIERQKAYEAELEKQKAAEDAKRMEEIKRQEAEMQQQNSRKEERNSKSSNTGGTGNAVGSINSGGVGDTDGKVNTGGTGNTGGSGSTGGTGNTGGSGSPEGTGNTGGNSSPSGSSQSSSSDLSLLAAIIQCEAGGESYEGKLAVGSVVMNRVGSSHFPNTVAGVIYQSGQFSPVASGRFAAVLAAGANQNCTQAAKEVLGGNITIGCLYFRRNDGSISGTVIGNHVFY